METTDKIYEYLRRQTRPSRFVEIIEGTGLDFDAVHHGIDKLTLSGRIREVEDNARGACFMVDLMEALRSSVESAVNEGKANG